MRFLLRLDYFVDAAELALNTLDLMPRGARQPPLRAVHNRHHHFQIA